MQRILLITNDIALQSSAEQLASLVQAQLVVTDTPLQQSLPRADLVLWHTSMLYNHHIYTMLAVQFPKVVILCERGRGELLGSGSSISVPYIIVPFDPEDAATIIKSIFK